jgi:hypothetical protein
MRARPRLADPSRLRRRACLACVGWPLVGWTQSSAPVPVLYPEIAEPFRTVFARIIDGMATRIGIERIALAADPAQNAARLADLQRRGPRVLIALGRGRCAPRSAWRQSTSSPAACSARPRKTRRPPA